MTKIAIVLPTYNERLNLPPLLQAIEAVMSPGSYEVIVVDDDSPDGTASTARSLSRYKPYLRVIQRINRRGLSSACIEGMMATSADIIAVMDADLQHDEHILPKMVEKLERERLDIVVGTRLTEGGSMGELGCARQWLSQLGRKLSKLVCGVDVSDPMSGYFVLTRSFLDEVVRSLSGTGFKILLDLLATSNRVVRVGEVGYTFRSRQHGESKLDMRVGLEYLQLLLDKSFGHFVPPTYILFCLVGTAGIAVHLVTMRLLLLTTRMDFTAAQACSSLAAMTGNYFLNNAMTFRPFRLNGNKLFLGLILFCCSCSVGLLTNLMIASSLLVRDVPWFWAAASGIAFGSVWNYCMSYLLVWRIKRRRLAVRRTAPCHIGSAEQQRSL